MSICCSVRGNWSVLSIWSKLPSCEECNPTCSSHQFSTSIHIGGINTNVYLQPQHMPLPCEVLTAGVALAGWGSGLGSLWTVWRINQSVFVCASILCPIICSQNSFCGFIPGQWWKRDKERGKLAARIQASHSVSVEAPVWPSTQRRGTSAEGVGGWEDGARRRKTFGCLYFRLIHTQCFSKLK